MLDKFGLRISYFWDIAQRSRTDTWIALAQQIFRLEIEKESLASTMNVQVKNEESDTPAKYEETAVPMTRGEQHVQVKVEEEVSTPPPRPSPQLRIAPSIGASGISSRYQRSSSSLPTLKTSARSTRLAVHNNASAIAPSAAPVNLTGCHGPARASLSVPTSPSRSDITTNVPPPSDYRVRQPALTRLQSVSAESKTVPRHQTASFSDHNPVLDALVAPSSTPSSQFDQHMQGKCSPVSSMKTTKLMKGPAYPGVIVPFCKDPRAWLDDELYGDWIYTTSTGIIKKLPQLGSCGPWQVPLPSNMDTTIHIDPYIHLLSRLLNVRIQSTKSPPSIHVKLFESQIAEQEKDSCLLEEHTAMKWKAWAVLAAWVDHLVRRGAPPAIPPIDLVSFVRNKILAEGRHAKAAAVDLLHERQGVVLPFEGHGILQMPRLTPADLLPQPRPSLSVAQKPSLMPFMRPPQASKSGHKHLLSDDSSSSSSSESSPEVQTKRLRRKK
ncbi:hypothetical protein LX32DRAFT_724799 [Colletotrichum zoysiae]|uniref:Uncharacterized protein n=1 Tax=Colletotrichum zoysiae TaxID=1216348 RepID=A0AAD9HSS1_9PEZI|nr:hypothetical protein LX32DRAFT_724799 [Colletotrichum zoysiae]